VRKLVGIDAVARPLGRPDGTHAPRRGAREASFGGATFGRIFGLPAVAPTRAMLAYDASLAWATLLLLAIGLVMVYSASIAMAESSAQTGHRYWYYLARHGAFVAVGLAAAVAAFQVPLKAWEKLAPWLFVAGIALLVVVLIPGIGRSVNGSRRWLSLYVVNVQPSEFMKLAVILYAASYAVRKAAFLHARQPLRQTLLRGFAPLFATMVAIGGLLLLEPDFGAFVVIVAIGFSILFLGGLDWRLFVGLSGLLPLALGAILVAAPYRMQRLTAFLDPWSDPLGKGYQLSHSLIAFGRGELGGVGLGASVEKLLYLPEAHTDFLLAVIAEELGFAGVAVVLALFAWVIYRAWGIGRQAVRLERPFAALVAQGIGVWIGVQAFINIGVNMGVLPTKGLTLPLLSFGGSAIVANCVAIAILLRVDYENRRMLRGYVA
jgi:cell division protein FtsW